jgi:hypothetical protein
MSRRRDVIDDAGRSHEADPFFPCFSFTCSNGALFLRPCSTQALTTNKHAPVAKLKSIDIDAYGTSGTFERKEASVVGKSKTEKERRKKTMN